MQNVGGQQMALELKKKTPQVRQEGTILKVAKGVLEVKGQAIIIS